LRGAYKQKGECHFTHSDSERTRENDFKLKDGRLRLDVIKKFFTQMVMKHWNRFPEKLLYPWRYSRPGSMGPWAA